MAGMAAGMSTWVVASQRVRPSKGSVPLVARHCLERLLDDADQDRHIEHREREGTREDREAPAELQGEDQHAEEADDDRGRLESVSIAVFAMFVTGPTGAYCVRKMAPPREIGSEIRSVRIKR